MLLLMTRLLAILLFIAPAMACTDEFTENVNKSFNDLRQRYVELADTSEYWRTRAETLEARKVQVVRITPVAAKLERNACPILTGRQKCKPGRTQSAKHNCKCGVWTK
jgi:hypothetical protein